MGFEPMLELVVLEFSMQGLFRKKDVSFHVLSRFVDVVV